MRKTFIWFRRHLKIVSVIAFSTIFFIACADDQDATTVTPDSPAVKSDDPKAAQAGNATNRRPDPRDMDTSALPILALIESDANRYPDLKFILRLNDTTDAALSARGLRPWYGIKFTGNFNPRNQERLNFHVHGYLSYHDMAAKDPPVRHTLFLKWHGHGANVDSVTVWLNPPNVVTPPLPNVLDRETSDPPRPKGPPPPPME